MKEKILIPFRFSSTPVISASFSHSQGCKFEGDIFFVFMRRVLNLFTSS
jgi:hypothetical protein